MAARGSVAERSKALDLGSSPRGDVGSNPTAASGARRPLLCPPPQNPSLNVPGLPYGEGGLHFCAPHPPKVPQVPRGEGEGTQTFVPSRPPPPQRSWMVAQCGRGEMGGYVCASPPPKVLRIPILCPTPPKDPGCVTRCWGEGSPLLRPPSPTPKVPKFPILFLPPPSRGPWRGHTR